MVAIEKRGHLHLRLHLSERVLLPSLSMASYNKAQYTKSTFDPRVLDILTILSRLEDGVLKSKHRFTASTRAL